MANEDWAYGPFGLDRLTGGTVACERTVLVAVHHLTAATRLADIVPLLECDQRVQVVYTWAPAPLSPVMPDAVRRYLRSLDGVVVPWQQAAQVQFDLAVAAAHGSLERLHAPVLTVSHGIGYNKFAVGRAGGQLGTRDVFGLERAGLVHRGRVIPSAVAVSTRKNLTRLRQACPEAAAVAVIAGDPCFDRLAVSLPQRDVYRRVLDVRDRTLVAVSSTWGPGALLRRYPELLSRLTAELPAERYQLAAIIHPGIWSWHGRRQVRAWLSDATSRGLWLLPPEEGWRGMLAAADLIIGDHGSVTAYGAAAGVPVLLAASAAGQVEPGSLVARLAAAAPQLRMAEPLAGQLESAAANWSPDLSTKIRADVTDLPGQSAAILRAVMYRLMDLAEPPGAPPVDLVPAPEPLLLAASPAGTRQ